MAQKDLNVFVQNPGTLLITREQYYRGGESVCRNKALQNMFSMLGKSEKAGSGVDKILQGWRDSNWRRPEISFTFRPDKVELSLDIEKLLEVFNKEMELRRAIDQATEESGNESSYGSNESSNESGNGSNESSNETSLALTDKQQEILEFCKTPRSTAEIFEHLGLTDQWKNRQRYIRTLLDLGLLEMTNPNNPKDKNQKYITITQPTSEN